MSPRKRMNRIENSWNAFQREVIPSKTSTAQIEEMKKVFYAGAATTVSVMARIATEKTPENVAVTVFDDLIIECAIFVSASNKTNA